MSNWSNQLVNKRENIVCISYWIFKLWHLVWNLRFKSWIGKRNRKRKIEENRGKKGNEKSPPGPKSSTIGQLIPHQPTKALAPTGGTAGLVAPRARHRSRHRRVGPRLQAACSRRLVFSHFSTLVVYDNNYKRMGDHNDPAILLRRVVKYREVKHPKAMVFGNFSYSILHDVSSSNMP
jgi:hypothetical protein